MSATTIRKTLSPYVAPQGKKYNLPISLGLPKIKRTSLECPVCSTYNKDGSVNEYHPKESPSAMTCKKCHEKQLKNIQA